MDGLRNAVGGEGWGQGYALMSSYRADEVRGGVRTTSSQQAKPPMVEAKSGREGDSVQLPRAEDMLNSDSRSSMRTLCVHSALLLLLGGRQGLLLCCASSHSTEHDYRRQQQLTIEASFGAGGIVGSGVTAAIRSRRAKRKVRPRLKLSWSNAMHTTGP